MKSKIITTLSAAMISFSAMASDFTITTGGEGGTYERIGYSLASSIKNQAAKKKIEVVTAVENSNGSIENIEKLNDGDAQIAIAQADALNVMKPSVKVKTKTAHTETVFWLYNTANGFSDLEDIEGNKDALLILVDGSGAQVTMQSFVNEDSGYEKNLNNAVLADDLYEAVDIVAEGKFQGKKVAGVLYVGGSIPGEVAADFASKVSVGSATDGDFNDAKDIDGDDLYQPCEISKHQMASMKSESWGDPDTVCVKAKVVYVDNFESKKLKRAVSKGITKALSQVK